MFVYKDSLRGKNVRALISVDSLSLYEKAKLYFMSTNTKSDH